MDIFVSAALWFTTVSVAIMTGVYFTFSAFVMRSLDAIGASPGMLAMQSINRIIVKTSFLPIFLGSTLTALALVTVGVFDLSRPGALWMVGGSALYVIGMFFVTIGGNVPLNDRLEASSAGEPDGTAIWALYLRKWTAWNHVRTLACIASLMLLIVALIERG